MLLAFVGYAAIAGIRDQSVSSAVVYGRDSREIRNTLFVVALALSLIGSLAFLLASPILTRWTGTDATGLATTFAIAFLVSGIGSLPAGMLARSLRFRPLAMAETGSMIVFAVVAIVLMSRWAAAVAIGSAQVVGATLGAAAVMALTRFTPSWHLDWAATRPLLGYQASSLGIAALTVVFANLDTLAVARSAGGSRFGAYALTFNVAFAVAASLAQVLQRVAFPSFAHSSRERFDTERLFRSAVRMTLVVALPVAATLFAIGPALLPVVFGPAYGGTGDVLRVLALYGLMWAVQSPAFGVRRALGQTRTVVVILAVQVGLALALLIVAVPRWGLVGAATSVTASLALGTGLAYSLRAPEAVCRPATLVSVVRSLGSAPIWLLVPVVAASVGVTWWVLFALSCLGAGGFLAAAWREAGPGWLRRHRRAG